MRVLLPGGTFVCKIFDTLENVTVSLISLLHESFGRIAVVKPITSRPASSERYVVCENFALDGAQLELACERLRVAQVELGADTAHAASVQIVDMTTPGHEFCRYIADVNRRLLASQTQACSMIIQEAEAKPNKYQPWNRLLADQEMGDAYLHAWKLL